MFSPILTSLGSLAAFVQYSNAASAIPWAAPGEGPTTQTANYTGFSNSTLNDQNVVPGASFSRFIQIWFENTNFAVASSTPAFQKLAAQGVTFSRYMAVTHPSEPNYVASLSGSHWGMGDDNFYHIPRNISTVIDLLEEKGISWATYQENMPSTGYYGYNWASVNYNDPTQAPYDYYQRKHNPPIIHDSVVFYPERSHRIRSFNDFANDIVNGTLPQWMFITPNMVNDAHDTTIDFAGKFTDYWLNPLLEDERFNNEETLILVTFDENETYDIQNQIFSVAVGGSIPDELKGTSDNTFYTHYSTLSTVQANWDLRTLGRQDANKTVSNVFSWVANEVGYQNQDIADEDIPQFNLTKVHDGPLNSLRYTPFYAPDVSMQGASGCGVFVSPELDLTFTADEVPPAVNLTAQGSQSPWILPQNTTTLPVY
ncbi:phosphoesterase-domain-containing protein [Cylindrobasidium torrendii FP15055 ss-10]|uniref:Phosphoesterase-domain-containing protein n=1 Tax=Cylindrobasidium torrendii FP15055 ss-10 TaxID=1314674 RepID=A0A0D7B5C5_9AGAR|nr:phosphoesterase-domain-containing protein [Cylindrobasidium torrendii FP15055 ss-10]